MGMVVEETGAAERETAGLREAVQRMEEASRDAALERLLTDLHQARIDNQALQQRLSST